jgi:hypothetical protein
MKRYFISQHPTFGSYENPNSSKIQKSPYYFWWLALTLNTEYIEFCDEASSESNPKNETLQAVYNDFGDVRYNGDKFLAFTKWWRTKVNATETRGEYLFAEPIAERRVQLIEDEHTAKIALQDTGTLLVEIPSSITRKQMDVALENIIKKKLSFERGRQTRNPSRSNARYSLSKPVKAESLVTSFNLYELTQKNSDSISNFKLAKLAGIEVNSQIGTEPSRVRRKISTAVSRKKKLASNAIKNVVQGWFL